MREKKYFSMTGATRRLMRDVLTLGAGLGLAGFLGLVLAIAASSEGVPEGAVESFFPWSARVLAAVIAVIGVGARLCFWFQERKNELRTPGAPQ